MTIYKLKVNKDNAGGVYDEALLHLPNDAAAVRVVSVQQRRRRMLTVCVVLLLAALATSAAMGVMLYRHLHRQGFTTELCSVQYYEYQDAGAVDPDPAVPTQRPQTDDEPSFRPRKMRKFRANGAFYEQVEIDTEHGRYEKLDVPSVLNYRRSTVIHDFNMNVTAIVDRDIARCFVMPLNRTLVQPPKTFLDLLSKFRSGYYLPSAEVLREDYRVVMPRVMGVSQFGEYVEAECTFFETFRLVRATAATQPHGDDDAVTNKRSACHFETERFCLGETGAPYMQCITLIGCV